MVSSSLSMPEISSKALAWHRLIRRTMVWRNRSTISGRPRLVPMEKVMQLLMVSNHSPFIW